MAENWISRQVGRILKRTPAGIAAATDAQAQDVLRMLEAFGLAMIESGQATNDVQDTLREIARVYDLDDLSAVVLPTFIVLQSAKAGGVAQVRASALAGGSLDQAGAIDVLVSRTLRRELSPASALAEIQAVRHAKPRFGPALSLLGHVVLTVGFGMVINPTLPAIPAYAILGTGVGALVLLSRRFPRLSAATPVIAAFLVTVATALLLAHLVGDSPLRIIAPPLVSFLPGLTLTIAAIELTANQVIAGASRLVYGVAQLLLLTFGVYAAYVLVGGIVPGKQLAALPWWCGLVGVALVGLGYLLFMSAPKGALPWLIAALAVCYGAQALGVLALGPALSGFVGALVIAPFARIASRFRTAPPAAVMSLACFWLLVPGALGFIGLSGVAQGGGTAAQTVTTAGLSVLAIALGALVGIGISRDAGRLGKLARKHAPKS